uniref:Uncharacterized protein n=1 Tax=Salix viminalis TaxID=40686 RepID=A0A6N2MH77_SALVM
MAESDGLSSATISKHFETGPIRACLGYIVSKGFVVNQHLPDAQHSYASEKNKPRRRVTGSVFHHDSIQCCHLRVCPESFSVSLGFSSL